jgi:hypothetical protein
MYAPGPHGQACATATTTTSSSSSKDDDDDDQGIIQAAQSGIG